MLDLKNVQIEDFEIIENTQKRKKGKVFVPFCRVKEGFKRREHKVSDMPEEIFALFKNRG